MRIGVSGYVGKRKTGIGRVLENVLINVALADPKIRIVLFINYDFKDFLDKHWPMNVQIVTMRVSKNNPIGNLLWHQFFYQRQLKKYNCDISFIPTFALILWKNRPTVTTLHDLIEFNVKTKFKKIQMLYRQLAAPLIIKKSDRIITVSNSSKNDIVKYLHPNESKITVIYNGYDKNLFRMYSKDETNKILQKYLIEYKGYILYVGTVDHPGKNLYSLILSFIKLKQKYNIKEKLVIIGQQGFNSRILFDIIYNSQYKNDIKYLGYVTDNDLPYFYSGAKLFCFISLYEGFGLPIIEAMACGCPVLTSNNSALAEVADKAALLVEPLKLGLISEKLYELLQNNNLRDELINKGYSRVRDFSWDKAASEYLNVFRKLSDFCNH